MSCVCIPVVTCRGRKGDVILGTRTYLKLEGSEYWDVNDGYLHIDESKEDGNVRDESHHWKPSEEEYIAAVKKLCIENFADKNTVSHDLFRISDTYHITGLKSPLNLIREIASALFPPADPCAFLFSGSDKPKRVKLKVSFKSLANYLKGHFTIYEKKRVEVVERNFRIPFGGTWQKYFCDRSWIAQAEELHGGKIYLAR